MAGWNDDTFVKWATQATIGHPSPSRERTCPHCLKEFVVGINGVVNGCDQCEGIVRLPNGMIDHSASSPEVFIKKMDS